MYHHFLKRDFACQISERIAVFCVDTAVRVPTRTHTSSTLLPNCNFKVFVKYRSVHIKEEARGGVVVKALRYKPAGRGFDSQWCQDFSP